MRYDANERAWFGYCSDAKYIRVEHETYRRVQREQGAELTPDQWAALYGKEAGVDMMFSSASGETTFMHW